MFLQYLEEGFASQLLVERDEVGAAEVGGFARLDGFLLSVAYIILAVPVAQLEEGSTLLVHYLVFVAESVDAARIPRYAEMTVGPVFFAHADGGLGVAHGLNTIYFSFILINLLPTGILLK